MLTVQPVPAFSDNYIWLLADSAGNALVVDPGDAAPVCAALARGSYRLRGVLVTHHHPDHVGGVAALAELNPGLVVYGPRASPAAACITHPLDDGACLELLGQMVEVLAVPGHTLDHLAYLFPASPAHAPLLFCGDTLFAGGCGRLFEGSAAQMHASLERLAALPAETLVHCAHEYTLSNLRFARAVEPGNSALATREIADSGRRARNEPTVPSTLALERATNPFLRSAEPAVRAAARERAGRELSRNEEVFAVIRSWKDSYR
jgi:hydroxyacylglutathione hydrolase